MKRLAVFLICVVAGIVVVAGFAQTPADSIRLAYERLMMKYPLCGQRDVYKNFFQDYFGPGHIVADTSSAANITAVSSMKLIILIIVSLPGKSSRMRFCRLY